MIDTGPSRPVVSTNTTPKGIDVWPSWLFWSLICLGAVSTFPALQWAYSVWFDGLLGGAAAAILSIPIAFVLGVLALRQPEPTNPHVSKPVSNAAPTVAICMVGLCIIALLEGALRHSDFLMLVGCMMPVFLYVCVWGRFGWTTAQRLALPIGFLLFALPWEAFLRGTAEIQLQAWTTDVAINLLEFAGYDVWYHNEYTIDSQRYYVIVNETCSGVNLTMSLLMYTLVYGWLVQPRMSGRWLLLFCVFPLALVANGLRVSTIFLLGHYGGNEWADGFWHTGSAYVIFLPIFWALHLINSTFNRRQTARLSRSKETEC